MCIRDRLCHTGAASAVADGVCLSFDHQLRFRHFNAVEQCEILYDMAVKLFVRPGKSDGKAEAGGKDVYKRQVFSLPRRGLRGN